MEPSIQMVSADFQNENARTGSPKKSPNWNSEHYLNHPFLHFWGSKSFHFQGCSLMTHGSIFEFDVNFPGKKVGCLYFEWLDMTHSKSKLAFPWTIVNIWLQLGAKTWAVKKPRLFGFHNLEGLYYPCSIVTIPRAQRPFWECILGRFLGSESKIPPEKVFGAPGCNNCKPTVMMECDKS